MIEEKYFKQTNTKKCRIIEVDIYQSHSHIYYVTLRWSLFGFINHFRHLPKLFYNYNTKVFSFDWHIIFYRRCNQNNQNWVRIKHRLKDGGIRNSTLSFYKVRSSLLSSYDAWKELENNIDCHLNKIHSSSQITCSKIFLKTVQNRKRKEEKFEERNHWTIESWSRINWEFARTNYKF